MMSNDNASAVRPSGLSLYANLLNNSTGKQSGPGTISRAPVVFKPTADETILQDDGAADKHLNAGTVRQPFQDPALDVMFAHNITCFLA